MLEQSFTLTVPTDAQGRFHSVQPVSSPFSIDIKITASLQSPEGVQLHGSFSLVEAPGPAVGAVPFSLNSGATADLGKWRAIAGEHANIATAEGYTDPVAANAELKVVFVAAPSFF
jgi:hypothetical protein